MFVKCLVVSSSTRLSAFPWFRFFTTNFKTSLVLTAHVAHAQNNPPDSPPILYPFRGWKFVCIRQVGGAASSSSSNRRPPLAVSINMKRFRGAVPPFIASVCGHVSMSFLARLSLEFILVVRLIVGAGLPSETKCLPWSAGHSRHGHGQGRRSSWVM